MSLSAKTEHRRLDYDLLRIIAIFGVVYNHTQWRGYELFEQAGSHVNIICSLILAVTCKIAVPLFFMVSGALLLSRQDTIRKAVVGRFLRILIALVVFSIITGLYLYATDEGTYTTPPQFVNGIIGAPLTTPYWYLYTYAALMLMLPFLQPLAQHLSDRVFVYLLILHAIITGVWGSLSALLGVPGFSYYFSIPFIERTLFYFLMGYYLEHRCNWSRIQKKHIWISILVSVLAVAAMAVMTWVCFMRTGNNAAGEPLLFIPVLTLYGLTHILFEKHQAPAMLGTLISGLGKCVFGVYLLEGILRRALTPLYNYLEPRIHVLPACFCWVGAVVISGFIITWILRKIPLVKKIL